ncbi:hypothetical protein SPI_06771 [Niveomyces insectorum RCEF 264]|uniref:RNase MRP protein 1 RNA binding domain-containing protein n=1 Tax=Niveomyces insectorum RCEF 264 TaxID=1081102 RepID=A0A167QRF1_9HYPO|nr:hypothetical protein SPI_06771 [Niveomyces insectorum RCEF 264]
MAPKSVGRPADTSSSSQDVRLQQSQREIAGDRLAAVSRLLAGFHRRHKNQHRVSVYWWPAFEQLRRYVRRLGARLRPVDGAVNSENNDDVWAYVRWLQRAFVPKAYLAFSRLVADRQFAPLGLLLMGVLAQVHAALKQVAGADVPADDANNSGDGDDTLEMHDGGEPRERRSVAADRGDGDGWYGHDRPYAAAAVAAAERATDLGVVVARSREHEEGHKREKKPWVKQRRVEDDKVGDNQDDNDNDGDEVEIEDADDGPLPPPTESKKKRRRGDDAGGDELDVVRLDRARDRPVVKRRKAAEEDKDEDDDKDATIYDQPSWPPVVEARDSQAGTVGKATKTDNGTDKKKTKDKKTKKKKKGRGDEFDALFSGLL